MEKLWGARTTQMRNRRIPVLQLHFQGRRRRKGNSPESPAPLSDPENDAHAPKEGGGGFSQRLRTILPDSPQRTLSLRISENISILLVFSRLGDVLFAFVWADYRFCGERERPCLAPLPLLKTTTKAGVGVALLSSLTFRLLFVCVSGAFLPFFGRPWFFFLSTDGAGSQVFGCSIVSVNCFLGQVCLIAITVFYRFVHMRFF